VDLERLELHQVHHAEVGPEQDGVRGGPPRDAQRRGSGQDNERSVRRGGLHGDRHGQVQVSDRIRQGHV
jgi:hypothetical protein